VRTVVVAGPFTEDLAGAFGVVGVGELFEELSDRGPEADAVERRSAEVPD
jgi:hypothetical protein